MRVGGFTFKPKLLPSLSVLLLLLLLLTLGFWQVQRAAYKTTLQQAYAVHGKAPYVPIDQVDLSAPTSHYRKVVARGRYDSTHQVLLDNQVLSGQLGYHVYTPLQMADMSAAILVNRGWVPLGNSRQQLPDIRLDNANVKLKGWIAQPANPGLRLDGLAGGWPRVVQYMDYDELSTDLGYTLLPAVILLDPAEKNGYKRDWRPHFGGFGPERHTGYAVQWFTLAAALLVIYLVVNTRRDRRPS